MAETKDHDIICMGASAGGLEALSEVIGELPADLNAAVFVVLHISPEGPVLLPKILSRAGHIPAVQPENGQEYRPGTIYVAPPNKHMTLEDGHIRVMDGPKENGSRPAIDPLFRSAAHERRGQVIGVVLTGSLDDGTAGLASVKHYGGIAVCQSPSDAAFPSMPRNAIRSVDVDYVLPLDEIAPKLVELSRTPAPEQEPEAKEESLEEIVDRDIQARERGDMPDTPSTMTCPECGGVIWEVQHDGAMRFECRTGHTYSPLSFLAEQDISLENALWSAVRALQERESLMRRLVVRNRNQGMDLVAQRFEVKASEARAGAEAVQQLMKMMELRAGDVEEEIPEEREAAA